MEFPGNLANPSDMTILIRFHPSHYRSFKAYYIQ